MDDLAKTVHDVAHREIDPLLVRCRTLKAEIDRQESITSEILDPHARVTARIFLIRERAKLGAVVSALEGMEDRVLRIARARWPQSR
jgi:hypothetical protein